MDYIYLVKSQEGCKLKMYEDTDGNHTIGVGRNLDANGISQDEADLMLKNDLDRSIAECRNLFINFNSLDEVRQAAIISVMFNLGRTSFGKFHLFINAITGHDYEEAKVQLLDSEAARELPSRYEVLADMVQTGEWQ